MKILTLVLCIALLLVAKSPAHAEEHYKKLRYDFVKTSTYKKGWFLSEERKSIITAYRNKEYKKVLELSQVWLKKYPVDAEVFKLCAFASYQKGQAIREIKCLANYYGLLSSIIGEENGLTEQAAFKVISVNEEYAVIRAYGGKLMRQSLIENKESAFDLMEIDVDGKLLKLYFDVSISFFEKK